MDTDCFMLCIYSFIALKIGSGSSKYLTVDNKRAHVCFIAGIRHTNTYKIVQRPLHDNTNTVLSSR